MNVAFMFKTLYILTELRRHENWTRQQVEAHQLKALQQLREYAYEKSPFYRRYHKGLTDRPLQELPVLTKTMVMQNFDELVTDPALHLEGIQAYAAQGHAGHRYKDRYWVNATSGSTGQPGFFLYDDIEWSFVLASFARVQEWSGLRINLTHRLKMATVASVSPWHMSSQVAATVESWWYPSLRIPASQPLSKTVEQLNDWKPEVLICYASMAGALADEQLAGRLHIHPKVVHATSEVLTSQTRQRAKEAWGEEPFNQYASTEASSVAGEHRSCRHVHLAEDLVITEVVDEKYRPVPLGEYGSKILITTLFSRTQPLIRYELNDSLRLNPHPSPCRLPFAVLDNVQGRVEDSLTLPAASSGEVLIRPLVINRIMDIVPVSGWQVNQQADHGLIVLLSGVYNGMTDEWLADQINKSLAKEGARLPYIRVEHVDTIPKTAAGKVRLIQAYQPN